MWRNGGFPALFAEHGQRMLTLGWVGLLGFPVHRCAPGHESDHPRFQALLKKYAEVEH